MRPEWFSVARVLFGRTAEALAIVFLALTFIQAGAARETVRGEQTSTSPIYDAQSFPAELERLKGQLENAGKSTEALRAYREALPGAWAVESGGRRYDVPADLLVSRLVKAERQPEFRRQEVDQARDYLAALAAESAMLSGQPAPPTGSAQTKLNAILSRSEYSHTRQESWWDRLRARVNEVLYNALVRVLHRVGGQKSLGYVLLWVGVCATAILIAYWIFRRWFRLAKVEEMALQSETVPLRSWQEWVFAAREAAGRGDYRMAIHCAYWAGIARLQDVGALSHDRAKTPREYLRALVKTKLVEPEALATRQKALSQLTTGLEKIWYGYQIATETDFRDSLTQLEALGCHLP